jgi:RNA polymerase sigma-70 factor (ECF subfamily)
VSKRLPFHERDQFFEATVGNPKPSSGFNPKPKQFDTGTANKLPLVSPHIFLMRFQIKKSKTFDSVVKGDEIGTGSTFQRRNWSLMYDNHSPEIDIASMSQLVNAAKDGDTAAHSEICRQVQGKLNQMADKHLDAKLRRKLNPSDIVQATLTRMVQGFGDFRGSSSAEFYGWLNAILKNEVNSTRRDFQRQRRDVRRETEPTSAVVRGQRGNGEMPDERLQSQEKMARFREVIDRLPPDQAQVIQLRSIQELSFEEVAQQMDRSANAASKLWGRALISLQQELAKLDDSFSS